MCTRPADIFTFVSSKSSPISITPLLCATYQVLTEQKKVQKDPPPSIDADLALRIGALMLCVCTPAVFTALGRVFRQGGVRLDASWGFRGKLDDQNVTITATATATMVGG